MPPRASRVRHRAVPALAAIVIAAGTLTVGGSYGQPSAHAADPAYTNPVPPTRCTSAQVASGNVAGCLLARYGDPATDGFGAAPAPGVGEGWVWTGNTYSGSPALAEFEATQIAANPVRIGSISAGTLETHTLTRQLFEGFLGELQAGGYAVRHVSGYSFRCTGDWDCSSGGPEDLSLHAWGLAIDMNSDANPIRTYADCNVPVATDLPEWAIRTAERWGLYWGGYGWNSSCNVAGSTNVNVSRDTPHFEFRGTAADAQAIIQYNLANNPNMKCFPSVGDDGIRVDRCNTEGLPEARTRLAVTTQPPAGATAALVNLTATNAAAPGYLTLESCAAQPAGPRQTSTLTYPASEAVATLAIVALDPDGRFCVYRATAVHSVVDVVGYLVGAASAGSTGRWLRPATPARLLDTRQLGVPVAAGTQATVPASAGDTLVNLAAVADGAPGYLQAGTCGTLGPASKFSNLNFAGRTAAGATTRSNLTLMRAGAADACVFSLADAHVIVDMLATLDPTDGFGWQVAPPRRVLDTRQRPAGMAAAGELIELDLATSAPAATLALTVTAPTATGYVSIGTCAELRAQLDAHGRPTTSNLNYSTGQTTTNLAVSALEAGKLCVYSRAAAHVIVDLQATLTVEHSVALVPVEPIRLHDSRQS